MRGPSYGALLNPSSQVVLLPVQGQQGVAAGTGDNTELTSAAINTKPQGSAGFMAAILAIAYKTTLTAAATLKVTIKIQESADGSNWDAAETLINAETLKTGALTNEVGAYELEIDISTRKQYIRFLITMDLSAGATDVFVYGATLIATGYDKLPQ